MAQTMSSSTCTGAILSTKVPRRHPGRQPMMSSRTSFELANLWYTMIRWILPYRAQRQEIRTASPAGNTVMSMGMDTITEPMPVAPPTIPPVNKPKATTAYIQNAIYNSQGHASEHSSRFHVASNCICLRVELGSPVEREAKYFNGLTVKKSSIKHGFSQNHRRKPISPR